MSNVTTFCIPRSQTAISQTGLTNMHHYMDPNVTSMAQNHTYTLLNNNSVNQKFCNTYISSMTPIHRLNRKDPCLTCTDQTMQEPIQRTTTYISYFFCFNKQGVSQLKTHTHTDTQEYCDMLPLYKNVLSATCDDFSEFGFHLFWVNREVSYQLAIKQKQTVNSTQNTRSQKKVEKQTKRSSGS